VGQATSDKSDGFDGRNGSDEARYIYIFTEEGVRENDVGKMAYPVELVAKTKGEE